MGHIPESFLPFPKKTLEEALNIMAEYHHNAGNQDGAKVLQAGFANLICYKDDEEAITKALKHWGVPSCRETMLPAFKEFQRTWLKMTGH